MFRVGGSLDRVLMGISMVKGHTANGDLIERVLRYCCWKIIRSLRLRNARSGSTIWPIKGVHQWEPSFDDARSFLVSNWPMKLRDRSGPKTPIIAYG